MTGMVWKPDVTVAAVAERDGKFLLVEERASDRLVLNQPAGHLEDGETFLDAVVRETFEESGWRFRPDAIVGIYLWRPDATGRSFLRVAFSGALEACESPRPPDRAHPEAALADPCAACGPRDRACAAHWFCAASTTMSRASGIPARS